LTIHPFFTARGNKRSLTVYRSIGILDTDGFYKLVADYINEHRLVQVSRELVKDPGMFYGKGEWLTYAAPTEESEYEQEIMKQKGTIR
jgi:hypothetical protein